MGSYAHLYLAGYSVYTTKNSVDPAVMTIFREGDRRVYERKRSERSPLVWDAVAGDDKSEIAYEYAATVAHVKERLDVLGYTLGAAGRAFAQGIEDELAVLHHDETLFPAFSEGLRQLRTCERSLLRNLQFQDWCGAYARIREQQLPARAITVYDQPSEESFLLRYALDKLCHETCFPFGDVRLFIRAFLDGCPGDAWVTQDITDVVEAGCYAPDEAVWDTAMDELLGDYPTNAKIIVLTEGSSDRELLARSLALLYPHLAAYYTFMDFGESNAAGGAAALVATIKAFAGSGIANRVVALFDNDTAARTAIRGLAKTRLPGNIAVLQYPDLESAKAYPTTGPTGATDLDVNGLAGSLELYFGDDVLSAMSGGRPPVQWRGVDPGVGCYQGEILRKNELQGAFREKLARCEADPRLIAAGDWAPMRQLLARLFDAFHAAQDPLP
jgi:hypothetical protein